MKNMRIQLPITDYTDFTHYYSAPKVRKKLDVGDIFMNQVECKKCGWIIRSKNRHHMTYCDCGLTSVDGGSWYQKTTGYPIDRSVLYKYLHGEEEQDDKTNKTH